MCVHVCVSMCVCVYFSLIGHSCAWANISAVKVMEYLKKKHGVKTADKCETVQQKSIGSMVRQCLRVQQQEGESLNEHMKRAQQVFGALVQQGGEMSVVAGVMLQAGVCSEAIKQQLADECVEEWQVTVDRLLSMQQPATDESECGTTCGSVCSSSSSSEGGSGRKKSYKDVVVQQTAVVQQVTDKCAQEGKEMGCDSKCGCEQQQILFLGCTQQVGVKRQQQQQVKSRVVKCWHCNKMGHKAAVCRLKQQGVYGSKCVGYSRDGNYIGGSYSSKRLGGVSQERRERDGKYGRWQGGNGSDRRVLADVVKARRLINMGFRPVRVMDALMSVDNDENRAIDKLLGECLANKWQKVGGRRRYGCTR
eukprot:GDKI01014212.1.p1 GENE.GDKI01014212.1~~GDKI01014212.1.p1  ORF type:complete len:364 (-),score=111.04 GDKI01014212.1:88-1179(-)